MKILQWLWAIFAVALKRLYAQKGLTLATLLGLVATIALVLSIPLYADAVYHNILRAQLTEGTASTEEAATGSPYTFLFQYIGSVTGPRSWEDIQPLDTFLSEAAAARLELPSEDFVRHFKTESFRLFPQQEASYANAKNALAWVKFGFISDMEHQITLLEGDFPAVATPSPDSTMEVLVNEALALKLGLQVGETYITFNRQETDAGPQTTQIPLRIAGVWQAPNPATGYWFYRPGGVDDLLLVPEESFFNRISPYMENDVNVASWYMVLDGSSIRVDNADALLNRINAVQQQASALVPDTSLDVSPTEALREYRSAANLLTVLLFAFSAPILALILTFIGLVVGLAVERQRNEIAILRSRGATMGQIIGIALLEGLILGLAALAIGLPIAKLIAQLIGQTQSFLNFSGQSDLQVTITPATLQFGLIAVGLAVVAQVIPTIGAARHTIITYKQGRARSLRPPWWQRAWLDVLLLIPAAYGIFLLRQQGSIVLPGGNEFTSDSPFQNPLLFMVPALGIFALTLFFLRLLPLLMSVLAWVTSYLGGIGLLLATRQLARSPGFYAAPMILLVLTLSLSAFTASLAQTLDNHLFDQIYYQYGADISLFDWGETTASADSNPFVSLESNQDTIETESNIAGPRWLFLPNSEYLKIPGVEAATRVATYEAKTELSGGSQEGRFLGLERADFPEIAYWRWDFSPSYLAELMNALALTPDGVLLPRSFINQHALQIGDTINVEVDAFEEQTQIQLKVVGGFDLFPTWYPEDGPLFVGNLDYFFEQVGGQYPHNVWLKAVPEADYNQISDAMRVSEFQVLHPDMPITKIIEEQQNPERQGLFGLLSVGFGAAALLTVLGFFLYAFFSFRQRFIELGVLRAVGLSSGQMTIFLAWELAFLILAGLIIGTFLGSWASQLFIPFLQVGADVTTRVPPFLVEIAWPAIFQIYLLFGLLFIVALIGLVLLLLRMRIFQAIKLGETV